MSENLENKVAEVNTDTADDVFDADKDGPDEQVFKIEPINDDVATPEEIAQVEADFAQRMKFNN